MGRKSPCEVRRAEIEAALRLGKTVKQTASELGFSHLQLQAYCQRHAIRAPSKRGLAKKIDETRLRSLLELGQTHVQIAQALGVSRSCVERRCKVLGLGTARTGPRSGQDHPQWRSGRVLDKHGYVEIYVPLHPMSRRVGRIAEHRLVMEVVLGRYLLPGEVVDHQDDHPHHNWPENLRVFASNADHLKAELTDREKATPRSSIPGAYGSNQTIDRCPEESETLARCPSEIRQMLERHIRIHRPTIEHRMLSRRAILRSGATEEPFQRSSKD